MEREEGELSDEELEDVSDNSSIISMMPLIMSGKSALTTRREPFRELSLTSVSDDSDDDRIKCRLMSSRPKAVARVCHKHKQRKYEKSFHDLRRTRRTSERRVRNRSGSFRRQYSSLSSSTDSEQNTADKKMWRQLRDAVRINTSNNLPNCSLRTRIKRMIEPDSKDNNSNDEDLEALRDQALQSKQKTDNADADNADSAKDEAENATITDEDLIELRLIALQSAVMKKHQDRRKRKEQVQQQKELEQNIPEPQENIGIPSVPDTADTVQASIEETAVFIPTEIKEACPQISTEVTKDIPVEEIKAQDNDPESNVDEDEDILRAMLLTSISKKISNKISSKQTISELSKDKTVPAKVTLSVKPSKPVQVKNSKPSIPVNRIVINVNSDSESDCDHIEKNKSDIKTVKTNDVFNKNLSLFLQQARAKSETCESDIAKHLPRSQQLEYKRLKRKLHLLSTRMKPHAKTKRNDGKDENRLKLSNISLKRTLTKGKVSGLTSLNGQSVKVVNRVSSIQNPLVNKAKQVKEDRLQIKGKYEELGPLMARVSEARSARDRAQAEVKRLINDLRDARAVLTSTHQTYTVLIQQLVDAKANIDKREDKQEKNKSSICTSTPNKTTISPITCELSQIEPSEVQQQQQETLMEICPPEENKPCEKTDNLHVPEVVDNVPSMDRQPADILKYTSPLDHMQLNREQNPLLVLCPYDLLGVCRDQDCAYRHCGNGDGNGNGNAITN